MYANHKSHRKEIKEADSQIQGAEDMRKETMDLLQKRIEAKDSKKVFAANAILKRSGCLFNSGEKRKMKPKSYYP